MKAGDLHIATLRAIVALVATASIPAFAWAQTPGFRLIEPRSPFRGTTAVAVSSDGKSVAGGNFTSINMGFFWSESNGRVDVPPPAPFQAGQLWDISDSGEFAAGAVSPVTISLPITAARAHRDGTWDLIPIPNGYKQSLAFSISGDGQFLGGHLQPTAKFPDYVDQAFMWSPTTGTTLIPHLFSNNHSYHGVQGINRDGSVAVGIEDDRAWRWSATGGLMELQGLAGALGGASARAVSADGKWVAGDSDFAGGTVLTRWNAAGVCENLGRLPGTIFSTARAISDDGNTVGGVCHPISDTTQGIATLWTPTTGLVRLDDYLISLGFTLPSGINLYQINGISGDGTTIVGQALIPGDVSRAFVVTIPSPSGTAGCLGLFTLTARRRRRR